MGWNNSKDASPRPKRSFMNGGAVVAAALSLFGSAGDARAQSQDPYYNDPNRPLAENIKRFNQAQAERRAAEAQNYNTYSGRSPEEDARLYAEAQRAAGGRMTAECAQFVAGVRADTRGSASLDYVAEDMPYSCSPQTADELMALVTETERRREAADRRSRGGNP